MDHDRSGSVFPDWYVTNSADIIRLWNTNAIFVFVGIPTLLLIWTALSHAFPQSTSMRYTIGVLSCITLLWTVLSIILFAVQASYIKSWQDTSPNATTAAYKEIVRNTFAQVLFTLFQYSFPVIMLFNLGVSSLLMARSLSRRIPLFPIFIYAIYGCSVLFDGVYKYFMTGLMYQMHMDTCSK